MRLVTWNIQGLPTKIDEIFRETNIDVIALTETKKKVQKKYVTTSIFIAAYQKKKGQIEVSIVIKKKLRSALTLRTK